MKTATHRTIITMTHFSQQSLQNWCAQVMWTGSSAAWNTVVHILHSTSPLCTDACDGLGKGLARLSCTCGLSLKSVEGGVTPHFSQHTTGLSIQASSKVSRDHSVTEDKHTLKAKLNGL